MKIVTYTTILIMFAGLTLAQTATWDGSTDRNWTQPDATSWGAGTYDDGYTAIFGDTGAGVVTNIGTLTPGAISIDSGNDYTFRGGSIGGTGSLSKAGSGKLTLASANTFSGDVTLNGCTLALANNNGFSNVTVTGSILDIDATGLGPGVLGADGGSLIFNGTCSFMPQRSNTGPYNKNVAVNSGTTTFSMSTQYYHERFTGVLSGGGTIAQNNQNGTVTFSNPSNTFTGAIRLNSSKGVNGVIVHSLPDSANPIRFEHGSAGFALAGAEATATSLEFNSRQIELITSGAIRNNNSSQNRTFTVNTDLLVSTAGNKTLTLGGSNTGNNRFTGAITNGIGATVSLTKSDGGKWSVSGTNTCTGNITSGGGTLIFQGKQSIPSGPNITLGNSTTKFLVEGTGVINLGHDVYGGNNQQPSLFVGNNSAANGGSAPSSTSSNITVELGKYTVQNHTDVYNRDLFIKGTNGYRLKFNDVTLCWQGMKTIADGRKAGAFLPTTAPVTMAGTIIQPNGKTAYDAGRRANFDYLYLAGTATGNLITATIKDAQDYTAGTNANATPLGVYVDGGEWTFAETNAYSGSTYVNSGTLVLDSPLCLPDGTNLLISGSGKLHINQGIKEMVDSLWLSGVQTNSGKWGSLASSAPNKTDFITGEGYLYVGIPIPSSGMLLIIR